jgi:hypothetical protein
MSLPTLSDTPIEPGPLVPVDCEAEVWDRIADLILDLALEVAPEILEPGAR